MSLIAYNLTTSPLRLKTQAPAHRVSTVIRTNAPGDVPSFGPLTGNGVVGPGHIVIDGVDGSVFDGAPSIDVGTSSSVYVLLLTTGIEDGYYNAVASQPGGQPFDRLKRPPDYDQLSETAAGDVFYVSTGAVNAGKIFRLKQAYSPDIDIPVFEEVTAAQVEGAQLPASTLLGQRGPGVNVTSEMRGLSATQYAALQVQVADGLIVFAWSDAAEFDTGTLVTVSEPTADDIADAVAPFVDANTYNSGKETISADPISLTVKTSILDTDGVYALADGTFEGQTKHIKAKNGITAITVTPATFFDGVSITFSGPGVAILQWFSDGGWHLVNNGVTVI